MSAPTRDSHMYEILVRLFPWLSRVGIGPTTKSLEVKSENGKIDIAEGALAPVARHVGGGDIGFFYAQVSGGNVVQIWWSGSAPPNAAWTSIATGAGVPGPMTAGTPIDIVTGSKLVRSA